MKIKCAYCGTKSDKPTGEVGRARRAGLNLYCDRKCSGLGRRGDKTSTQKIAEKRLYDIEYRRKNRALLKVTKHAYFVRTYDPAKAAVERKKNMPRHVEYCRRPAYKRWKSEYDRKFRARKNFGPLAEVAMLVADLNREIKERAKNHDIKYQNGATNKTQRREREARQEERSRPRTRDRRRDHSAVVGKRA